MDDYLCQSIRQALRHPADSPEHNAAIEAVCFLIDHIPEIQANIDTHLRGYIPKALKKTEKDVKEKISEFPEKYDLDVKKIVGGEIPNEIIRECFIRWVRGILKRDCIDVYRSEKRRRLCHEEDIPDITLNNLDDIIKEERLREKQRVITYIQEDPEGRLQKCYPRNNPDCNCQVLLKMYLVEGLTMDETAERIGAKKGTVRERLTYQTDEGRQGRSCVNLIKEIAKNDLGIT